VGVLGHENTPPAENHKYSRTFVKSDTGDLNLRTGHPSHAKISLVKNPIWLGTPSKVCIDLLHDRISVHVIPLLSPRVNDVFKAMSLSMLCENISKLTLVLEILFTETIPTIPGIFPVHPMALVGNTELSVNVILRTLNLAEVPVGIVTIDAP
jgi:hypothetical protein